MIRDRRVFAVVLFLVLAGALWIATGILARDGAPFLSDFIAYWGVGRTLLDGGNPYDLVALREIQLPHGLADRETAVVRYPPWALALLLPFAAMEYARGWFVWMAGQVILVGGSAAVLWRMFGGPGRPAIAAAITFWFPPALFVAFGGQITGLLLVGLTGFTWAAIHRKDYVAGLFLFLLTFKPHLLVPFGIAVLVWMTREKRFRPLLGVLTGVVVGSLVALLFQPEIFQQYLAFARGEVPEEDVVATVGAGLRWIIGFEHFWLQWIPLLLGAGWALFHSLRKRGTWDWAAELPLLSAVSWVSAPYGWVFDMTLLVPTVLDGAARIGRSRDRRLRRLAPLAFVIFGLIVWAQHLKFGPGVAHAWVGPIVLLAWLGIRRVSCRNEGVPADP